MIHRSARSHFRPAFLTLSIIAGLMFADASGEFASRAFAQTGTGGPPTNQGQGGQAGIVIDPDGVLRTRVIQDIGGLLMRERVAQAKGSLAADVAKPSALRKISLNRLEQAIEAKLAAGGKLTDEMNYLAGLTRVQYVFCYPETNDIVLAGPAEGWVQDLSGRTVGLQSGRPMLELQDLVAALRVYAPGHKNGPIVGCSIDPTQEGLAKMQAFLRQIGGRATPNDTQFIVDRMKLIAIGLENPEVKMTTFIQRATTSIARNALIRWYFVPDYQCLRTTEDNLALEMVGKGVKLVGENEVVQSDGSRAAAATTNGASLAFTTSFTQKYDEISQRKPVYAQLRNLIDLTIAAAFIQKHDLYGQAGWTAGLFLNEGRFPIQTQRAPLQVDTVVTSLWKGNRLLTPVAGGVTIQARQALKPENLLADDKGQTAAAKKDVVTSQLKPGQWWWD